MWIYIIIFFVVVILYYQQWNNKISAKGLLYVMISLGLFVGLADMLGGYDRYIYGEIFDTSVDIRLLGGGVYDVINQGGAFEEKGYMVFNYIMSFLTANRYIFILLSTMLIFLSFWYAFKTYIKEYPLYAVILFLGLFFFITFTYLREVLAICISFYALKAVVKRRLYLFLFLIWLAYNFHHSAIILLPIYFVPLKKWKKEYLVLGAILCAILGVFGASSIGFSLFSQLTGGNRRADMYLREYDVEGYFRIDFVAEAFFFLWCILSLYDKIEQDKKSMVLLNYSLFFCYILLLFTRSAQGGRLSWYFMIGILTLLTNLVHRTKTQWRIILLFVSFFLFLRIANGWGILLSPYKSFLTDGYRKGDVIHDKFEYDYKYDKDKFYRDPWLLW